MRKTYVLWILFILWPQIDSTALETDFMTQNGGKTDARKWQLIRSWYQKGEGEKKLKKFCFGAHKVALNETKVIESVSIEQRTLKFMDPKYTPMQVDVVKYGIDLEGQDPQKAKKYWWFAEGHKSGCVYYLVPVNALKTEFGLLEYVCNVKY